MKTIKIIDLLNKMANGEKVKPFEIYGEKYYVNEDGYINDRDGNVNWLIYDKWLNEEVEILDEEDEFEEFKSFITNVGAVNESNIEEYIHTLFKQQTQLINNQKKIIERLKEEGK